MAPLEGADGWVGAGNVCEEFITPLASAQADPSEEGWR